MDLLVIVTTLSMILKLSHAIQCYQCYPEVPPTVADDEPAAPRLCQYFNKSDYFVKECGDSTMCFKRVVTLDLRNGDSTAAVTRGCASQTTEGEQIKVNRHWKSVKPIHEVYQEACTDDEAAIDKVTKTRECYCRGGLCNSSFEIKGYLSKTFGLIWLLVMSVREFKCLEMTCK